MWSEIARIIHVTDMHLFVDANGNPRSPGDRAKLVRTTLWCASQRWGSGGFARIAGGLHAHSVGALTALISTIDAITQHNGSSPIALVQSGDIEAYGGTELPHQRFPVQWGFPAFDYWTTQCLNLPLNGGLVVNIYGNHDVWPGTLPLFRPWEARRVEIDLRKRGELAGPLPDCSPILSGSFTLEFYRLNTIDAHFLRNTFADGSLSADSTLYSSPTNPASILSAVASANQPTTSNGLVVRILVMHHPPHFFNSIGTISDLLEGKLGNVNVLLPAFNSHRFHLVLSGHRHVINPPRGTKIIAPTKWGMLQRPLPGDTVQLVAGSATQFTPSGQDRPSFNLYSIRADDQRRLLLVDRTVYSYLSDLDSMFTPEPTETVIDQLSL